MKERRHSLLKLGFLITLSGTVIHLVNQTIAKRAQENNLLHSDKMDACFEWRFGKIYYSVHGSGTPLLLLHDLTASGSSYEWKSTIQTLAKDRTVYCVDLPGCGRSEKPKLTYTNFLYVQFINDFIKQVIQEATDVIATGLTASFVMTAAAMEPNNFGKLVFVNPNNPMLLNQVPTPQKKACKRILELPLLGTFCYHLLTSRSNIELAFTENYLYNPFHINAADVSAYYEASHRGNGNGRYLLASIIGNYTNFNVSHALRKLEKEMLIICGAGEENARETCRLYTKLNPSLKIASVKHTKHLPQLEAPVDFLHQICEFLPL